MTDKKTTPTITMAEQDIVEKYYIVEKHFVFKILNINADSCFISDESNLSDFSGCGLTDTHYEAIADEYDAQDKTGMSYDESQRLYYRIENRVWDNLVLAQIEQVYGLHFEKTCIRMWSIYEVMQNQCDLKKLQQEIDNFEYPEVEEAPPFKPRPKLSNEEIIKTTMNPFAYANAAGVSMQEARAITDTRHEEYYRGKIFKAYRPSNESRTLN